MLKSLVFKFFFCFNYCPYLNCVKLHILCFLFFKLPSDSNQRINEVKMSNSQNKKILKTFIECGRWNIFGNIISNIAFSKIKKNLE